MELTELDPTKVNVVVTYLDGKVEHYVLPDLDEDPKATWKENSTGLIIRTTLDDGRREMIHIPFATIRKYTVYTRIVDSTNRVHVFDPASLEHPMKSDDLVNHYHMSCVRCKGKCCVCGLSAEDSVHTGSI